MSVQLHAAHFRCDFNISSTDYPRLIIDGEYFVSGHFTIGADFSQLEAKVNNTIKRFFTQKEARWDMGEAIKPDLVLPLKREWFARIWNGTKRTEYREVKPYWTRRIGGWVGDNAPRFILFQIGYAKDGPRLLVQITCVDIGPCPYPEFRGDYYRIDFEVVQPYILADGTFYPLEEMPKMKEKKGGAA
jgi:hypothetical protein|nr:MAG TPA: helix-turn-helix domain-containing protein [Caudoviricetes sp.]